MSRMRPCKALAFSVGFSAEIATFSGRIAKWQPEPVVKPGVARCDDRRLSLGPVRSRISSPSDDRDLPFDQIHITDEISDINRIRGFIDAIGRVDLDHPAVVHHRHPAGDRHRLFLIVGHDHESGAGLFLNIHQFELRVLPQLLVERAQRFIQQQQLRRLGQRSRQRDPLPLTAGNLVRFALGELVQAAPVAASPRHAPGSGPSALWIASARKRCCPRPRDAETTHSFGTSCSRRACSAGRARCPGRRAGSCPWLRLFEPRQHPHQRGLAAARRSEQRKELAAA